MRFDVDVKRKDHRYEMDTPNDGFVGIVVSERDNRTGNVGVSHTYMTYPGFMHMDATTRAEMVSEMLGDARNKAEQSTSDTSAAEVYGDTAGAAIIAEMSREELLAEIFYHQREALSDADMNRLKHYVVHLRTSRYNMKLHEEAKFELPPGGLFGLFGEDND